MLRYSPDIRLPEGFLDMTDKSSALMMSHLSLIDRAVDQCDVVIWGTDMDGKIIISRGGGLEDMNLEQDEVVGGHIDSYLVRS